MSLLTLPRPSSFKDRPNAGEVIEILNENLPAPEPPIAPFGESRIKLTAASDQKKLGYKPLAVKLSETSEILDDRIDDFKTLVLQHHKLDESAVGSAAMQSTTEIVAVGRIASDSSEGKLNAASLVLETSRRMGGGFRVPLNVSKLRGYQFFPRTDRRITRNQHHRARVHRQRSFAHASHAQRCLHPRDHGSTP